MGAARKERKAAVAARARSACGAADHCQASAVAYGWGSRGVKPAACGCRYILDRAVVQLHGRSVVEDAAAASDAVHARHDDVVPDKRREVSSYVHAAACRARIERRARVDAFVVSDEHCVGKRDRAGGAAVHFGVEVKAVVSVGESNAIPVAVDGDRREGSGNVDGDVRCVGPGARLRIEHKARAVEDDVLREFDRVAVRGADEGFLQLLLRGDVGREGSDRSVVAYDRGARVGHGREGGDRFPVVGRQFDYLFGGIPVCRNKRIVNCDRFGGGAYFPSSACAGAAQANESASMPASMTAHGFRSAVVISNLLRFRN